MCLLSAMVGSLARAGEPLYDVDIPSMNAAQALNRFAEQTGAIMLFPYDLASALRANAVRGRYTLLEALDLLLRGTGLSGGLSDKRVVSISRVEDRQRDGGEGAVRKQKESLATRVFTFVTSMFAVSAASGQDATPQLEEVVVTAQKREEPLSKAPLAISAFSSDQLRDSGVTSIRDLTSVAPNLEAATVGPANSIMIATRGVFNADFNASGNPAVSTYIDGVYIGRTAGLGGAFYDLARVEVLRGPQGTLYGRNSTGGNVNVITAAPAPNFAAAADVSYGNYNDVQAQGMVNIPANDLLALRGAVIVHRNDGYYDTRGSTSENYWKANDYGARLSALLTPTHALKWRLTAEKFVIRGTPGYSIDTGPDGKPADGLPVFERPIPNRATAINDVDNLLIRSRIDASLSDHITLAYVAGYQKLDLKTQYSLTEATYDGFRPEHTDSQFHELDATFEVGIASNIAGATYFVQNTATGDRYRLPVLGVFSNTAVGGPSRGEARSWGIFDQLRLAVTDRLNLVGGIRYSNERSAHDAASSSFCPLAAYPNIPLDGPDFFGPGCSLTSIGAVSDSWNSVTWKANAEFSVSPSLFTYAGVTTGFKSGGLNPPAVGTNYSPEKVTNYETGIKYFPADVPVNVSATLYYMDYTDIQGYGFIGVQGITTNANGAAIYGTELESQWRPTRSDRFSGFLTYTHATYTKYLNAVDQQLNIVYPDISGNTLPHAPRVTARLEYAHDLALANGASLTPKISVYWQSRSYLRELNLPIDKVNAYTKTNLNLSYAAPGKNWSAEAFVYNLENGRVRNYALTALGRYFSDYDAPRTYGVRISYRY